jgi:alkaline phosphatase
MGPLQVEVAREAKGGVPLTMERLPVSGRATTAPCSGGVTDSAAAGTALATGHKTNNGMISVSPEGRRLVTILERAQAMYKATGIITTDALTGATPATFASHVDSRGERSKIAAQLAASGVDVMLGFWKGGFLPKAAGGNREDGRDLIAEMERACYQVVYTRDELIESKHPRLVGLFDDGKQAPALADMVAAALERLATNRDGFFLIVEGARIDWKCHDNDPAGAVRDTWGFDEAVRVAADAARRRGRTLLVVTADHETGGIGYEDAGRVRLLGCVKASSAGIAGALDEERSNVAEVLAEYAGIGDLTPAEVEAIKKAEDASKALAQLVSDRAGVTWSTGGHTGTPVPVFAYGPGSDQFSGVMDNTDVPRRIAQSVGIEGFPQQ